MDGYECNLLLTCRGLDGGVVEAKLSFDLGRA